MKSWSMNSKSLGAGLQINGLVAPGVPLTLSILRLKSKPEPLSGVKSSEKADIRNVFTVPGPVLIMFALTLKLVPVRPAGWAHGDEKLTTDESKVKSAWKPV